MLTEIVLMAPTAPGSRFDPAAFENRDGEPVRLTIGESVVAEAVLKAATVIDRGRAVTLRLAYDDDS